MTDISAAPACSIGLPVYNGENYLEQAIQSVLAQTFQDFELIISDNASTDGTEAICRRFAEQDPRILYVRQPRNIGAAKNYNYTFHLARGEYFNWLAHVRRGILLPVAVSTTVILAVGISSQLFFFDRLSNRSQAILENPFQDERESERILAYVEPFQHIAEQPQFLLLGQGVTVRYSESRVVPEQAGKATHVTSF